MRGARDASEKKPRDTEIVIRQDSLLLFDYLGASWVSRVNALLRAFAYQLRVGAANPHQPASQLPASSWSSLDPRTTTQSPQKCTH